MHFYLSNSGNLVLVTRSDCQSIYIIQPNNSWIFSHVCGSFVTLRVFKRKFRGSAYCLLSDEQFAHRCVRVPLYFGGLLLALCQISFYSQPGRPTWIGICRAVRRDYIVMSQCLLIVGMVGWVVGGVSAFWFKKYNLDVKMNNHNDTLTVIINISKIQWFRCNPTDCNLEIDLMSASHSLRS